MYNIAISVCCKDCKFGEANTTYGLAYHYGNWLSHCKSENKPKMRDREIQEREKREIRERLKRDYREKSL